MKLRVIRFATVMFFAALLHGKDRSSYGMPPQLTIRSSNFKPGDTIPRVHTCSSEERSPSLFWTKGPAPTKSYLLVMTDPDAPIPLAAITHWIVYNIPPQCTSLTEGITEKEMADFSILQGKRMFGKHTYLGPCPPSGAHRYFFSIYALDTLLTIPPHKATRKRVLAAAKEHTIGSGEMYGIYTRKQ